MRKRSPKKEKETLKTAFCCHSSCPSSGAPAGYLQYHQCLSSTATNGASVTLETVMNGSLLPSLTDDQNAFIENAEEFMKKHLDRKSKLMKLLWTTLSSETSVVHLRRWWCTPPRHPRCKQEHILTIQCPWFATCMTSVVESRHITS